MTPLAERAPQIDEVIIDKQKIEGAALEQRLRSGLLRLPPGSGHFLRIEFINSDFEDRRGAQFRYRLRGYSDNWIVAPSGEPAQFFRLGPGTFEFQVSAESPHAGWGPPAVFGFAIKPYFHETKPFYALCAAGGIVVFGSLYGARLRSARRMYRLESENAVSKERERIAEDMHDMLGASLTKIGLQTELINQKTASEKPVATEVQKLRQSVRNAVSELDEVIWLFSSSEASLRGLAEHLQAYAEDFLESSGVRLRAKNQAELPDMPVSTETRGAMARIMREALNNAVKHSGASHVWLAIDTESENLRLVVQDDGCGLKQSRGQGMSGNGSNRGLEIMRARVARLNGSLVIDQPEGAGTRITATIPLETFGRKR
jgi:signal transduction histidine kinase